MKHKWKRAAACALAIGMLFSLSACGKDAAIEKTVTFMEEIDNFTGSETGYRSDEWVNDRMEERGYSAAFLNAAGMQTKLFLYRAGAVFQGESYGFSGTNDGGAAWDGFTAQLTVSDVPVQTENLAVKFLTVNWRWRRERPAQEDTIVISWTDGYAAVSNMSMFELHGEGSCEYGKQGAASTATDPDAPAVPDRYSGTFVLESTDPMVIDRQGLIYQDPMQVVLEGGERVSFTFSVDYGSMFMEFLVTEEEGINGPQSVGYYRIDPADYRGSFTIGIARQSEVNGFTTASAIYYQNNGGALEESAGVMCNFRDRTE